MIRDTGCYTFLPYSMRRSLHVPSAPGRTFGAVLCLIAVILLWAPVWASAWQTNGMACCSGGMCMAHGHSKTNQPPTQQAASGQSPMDCEHHGGSALANCSMSCCHESNPSLATAVIFLLPEAAIISRPTQAIAAPANFAPTEFVQSFEPLSPPPRVAFFSL